MPKFVVGLASWTRASATAENVLACRRDRPVAGVVTLTVLLAFERLPAASTARTVYWYAVEATVVMSA